MTPPIEGMPPVGGLWVHTRGGLYRVVGACTLETRAGTPGMDGAPAVLYVEVDLATVTHAFRESVALLQDRPSTMLRSAKTPVYARELSEFLDRFTPATPRTIIALFEGLWRHDADPTG